MVAVSFRYERLYLIEVKMFQQVMAEVIVPPRPALSPRGDGNRKGGSQLNMRDECAHIAYLRVAHKQRIASAIRHENKLRLTGSKLSLQSLINSDKVTENFGKEKLS